MLKKTTFFAIFSMLVSAQEVPAPLKSRDLSIARMGSRQQLSMPVDLPRGYAVVIGISGYKNLPNEPLPFAEKDAQNIYSVLIGKEGGNLGFENVVKLIGPDATLSRIQDTLERWLPSQAKATDRVVVFFVGHGLVDKDGRGYLAPYDIDPNDMSRTGYSMDRLGEVLSHNVKAKWKMLLTDACHSGKITVNSTNEKVNEVFAGLPQGFVTLTSSRASQSSYEDRELAGGNGVFSYFLARGWLGEADADPADGKVTADELIDYVRREVRNHVKSQGHQQTPQESGDFTDEMVLGFSPSRRAQLVASADVANGSLMIEVNLTDVEVAIDGQRYAAANPNSPLRVPGLASGSHVVTGTRLGYEPVTVEINLVPGSTQTVSLRFVNLRTVKPSAKLLNDEATRIWVRSKSNETDLAKAADLYSRALKEDKNFSLAALGLCRVRQAQNRTEEALKTCARAVEIDSGFVEARAHYAVLLMDRGDYDEAVRQLQRCTASDPSNMLNHTLLAEALFWVDRFQEAETEATRSLELDDGSGQAYFLRAEARRLQDMWGQAREDYRSALRRQEFGSSLLRVAAYWSIGSGMQKHRTGKAVLYRNQTAASYFGLCACALGEREFLEGVRFCRKVLAVDRDDVDAHLLLGELYTKIFNEEHRRDQLLHVKESLEATLRINPNHARAEELRTKLKEVVEMLPFVH